MPASSTGRPRAHESRRRTHELLARLADGATLVDAAKAAKVKPARVLSLLDDPQFRQAAFACREAAA